MQPFGKMMYRARRRFYSELLTSPVGRALYRVLHGRRREYTCPICGYRGPFADVVHGTGPVRHSMCLGCGLYERHRLQYLALNELSGKLSFSSMSLLSPAARNGPT